MTTCSKSCKRGIIIHANDNINAANSLSGSSMIKGRMALCKQGCSTSSTDDHNQMVNIKFLSKVGAKWSWIIRLHLHRHFQVSQACLIAGQTTESVILKRFSQSEAVS